jgi:hypothetical protein
MFNSGVDQVAGREEAREARPWAKWLSWQPQGGRVQ